jgi:hypothetical protein
MCAGSVHWPVPVDVLRREKGLPKLTQADRTLMAAERVEAVVCTAGTVKFETALTRPACSVCGLRGGWHQEDCPRYVSPIPAWS